MSLKLTQTNKLFPDDKLVIHSRRDIDYRGISTDALVQFLRDQGFATADGESAYQIWLAAGNTGTEADFIASLSPPSSRKFRYIQTPRIYCNVDNRWVNSASPNYGVFGSNITENAGANADPIIEWENIGWPFVSGDKIENINLQMRSFSTNVTDIEIYIAYITPNSLAPSGQNIADDSHLDSIVLYRDFWWNNSQNPFTERITHWHKRVLNIDYNVTQDGWLNIFYKPSGTRTQTTYAYPRLIINAERAP